MKKIHIIMLVTLLVVFGSIFYQKYSAGKHEALARMLMMTPPTVEVTEVTQEEYADRNEVSGRIQAKYAVDVIARINGWLEKRYFEEGAFVKKGQQLFLIEPREYKIAVDQAKAALRQAEATLTNAEKELIRARELVKNDYVSKSYYDKALATRDQSKATCDMRKAELNNANRNLAYTNITSPINGKIGKIYITEGNLVNQSTGKLATIVSNDPIYADYNLKSQDYIKYKRMESDTKNPKKVYVKLLLADGKEYPYEGKIEFVNNIVDETVGTIQMRATFPNPNNMLVPGDYVTVITTEKIPELITFVPQEAVLKGTEGSFVYVVSEAKDPKTGKVGTVATIRQIVTGDEPVNGKWKIKSGLKAGEKVAISGLTNIRVNPATGSAKVTIAEQQPDGQEAGPTSQKSETKK